MNLPFWEKNQRIGPFSFRCDSKDRFFFLQTPGMDLFFLKKKWLTLIIQPFWTFSYESKNWTFCSARLKEMNLLFCTTQRNELFFSMTHGIVSFCFNNMTRRIEPSSKIWPSRIEPFEKCDSRIELFEVWFKKLNLFFWIRLTELRIDFFQFDSKHSILLVQFDSKNWTFFLQMTRRLELSFRNMSQRIKPFLKKNDSNWFSEEYQSDYTNFLMTQRIELFWNMTFRTEPFFQYDSWKLNLSF